jgi:hypothetical protein
MSNTEIDFGATIEWHAIGNFNVNVVDFGNVFGKIMV